LIWRNTAALVPNRPEGNLPTGDILLAQKIALETNEQATLQVANRTLTY
jgi:hypothetical protein